IESATIQLLGANNEPVPAIVEDPQTPVYISLIIDGSGSMQEEIGDVREAARSAIDSAPPTSFFSVIQFHEESIVIQDFTNDHNRIKSAIDTVESVPNKGTCLYDTLFNAIGQLDDQIQNPQERRAIILFTDGKDQLTVADPAPCSRHTYAEVIAAARPGNISAPITPIHTIGLTDDQGGGLNDAELRSMAADTIAFSAIGNQTNLTGLFQEILDGLNSQLVARANVFAAQGENQAVLTVKVRNNDSSLTAPFNFFSNTNYDLPPPPVNIQVSSLRYDEVIDVYNLSLSLTNPESIRQLIINVWDVRRGTQVSGDLIFENPEATPIIELDASEFEAGREYSIHVQALNKDEFLIINEDEETLLAESEFTYEPPQLPEAVEFTIQSVNADYVNGILIIDLDVADNGRIQTYEGFIVDEETGGKVHEFGPASFIDGRIEEILPPAIQSSEIILSYRVTVYLTTEDQLRSEANYDDFKPIPPEPPGLMARIAEALSSNPVILGGIVVIILAVIAWLMIRGKQEKKQAVPIVRPPVDKTNIFIPSPSGQSADDEAYQDWFAEEDNIVSPGASGVGSSQSQLLLKVIRTESQALDQEKTIVSFPCVVGREGCDVNIGGDRRISRRHLEINVRGSEIFVTDLGSSNGTYIADSKLVKSMETSLKSEKIVRLGSQTHLELELLKG
ncbi:MAG: VWA domain-containing protein, partial [Chloroflexi bacterium]|nr:VWA domain-containing protein [Chloroflexota bacterium]